MNWKKLKNNKCPKCEKGIQWDNGGLLICSNPGCTFTIKEQKAQGIINDRVNEEIKKANTDPEQGYQTA